MGGCKTSSSSSSSSSSSQSSGGHCQREEKGMGKFEHLSLHHPPPPPRPFHSGGKKHHRHRPHSYPPPSHHRHHYFEHPPMDGPHHHNLPPPPPMGCPHHHHHKEGKLRVKPPKHLKKVHKLHRKLMKAYKLPKSARHVPHHHFPGFFNTHFGHHHPPGCCLHSMKESEGPSHRHELSILHRYHPGCHGRHPHLHCPMRSLIKSEVAGGEVAQVEPPIEGGAMPLASDMAPTDEPAPV